MVKWEWWESERGTDRRCRAPRWARRPGGWSPADVARRRSGRAKDDGSSASASHRAATRGPDRQQKRIVRKGRGCWRRSSVCPFVATHRAVRQRPMTSRRTRRACASQTARCSPTRAASSASGRSQDFKTRRRREARVRRNAERIAEHGRDREGCASLVLGQAQLPGLPYPGFFFEASRWHGRLLQHPVARGYGIISRKRQIPSEADARGAAAAISERLKFEIATILKMGFQASS